MEFLRLMRQTAIYLDPAATSILLTLITAIVVAIVVVIAVVIARRSKCEKNKNNNRFFSPISGFMLSIGSGTLIVGKKSRRRKRSK